jgi:RNA polymerase sigma factor (TIGR02999 family)
MASQQDGPDITALLVEWNGGDARGLERLIPAVYDELLRLARSQMNRESPQHTLSPTALVHEAYLRLFDQRRVRWENRAHFFGAAANMMRRILVDHAKKKKAQKRGGEAVNVAMEDDGVAALGMAGEDVLAIDEALTRLATLDARKVQVVEMKFFAGMTNPEIAAALGISDATVERDWKMARAWLILELGRQEPTGPSA